MMAPARQLLGGTSVTGTRFSSLVPVVSRRRMLQASAASGLVLAGSLSSRALPFAAGNSALAQTPVPDDLSAAAIEAYIYGYPLISVDVVARQATNVAAPEESRAPVNQIGSRDTFPGPDFKRVVAPNVDTLYSITHLDLTAEPLIFQWPALGQRYFLFPFLDAWTNVIVTPGSRTTGQGPGTLLIAGPDWDGATPAGLDLPDDIISVRSPTNIAWGIARIYTTGTEEDRAAVHAIQEQLRIVPLSAWGTDYTPPAGTVDPAINMDAQSVGLVNGLDAAAYFGRLAELLDANPPSPADAPLLSRLAALGIEPGKPFDLSALDPAVRSALEAAPKAGLERIVTAGPEDIPLENGWNLLLSAGDYGTDYLVRAFVALIGLGANRIADAFYPNARRDSAGELLDGANNYVVHFTSAPPMRGFWSLTAYTEERFLVPNSINRYAIRSDDPLVTNDDGSFDLYVQADSPGGDKEANWLPVPAAAFSMTLRIYWPEEAALDGDWPMPTITKAS